MKLIKPKKRSHVLDTRGIAVRQRWMDLIDISYSTRRVTQQEIELGVHAVVVPAVYANDLRQDLLEIEFRAAVSQVPAMAHGLRLAPEQLSEFGRSLPADYNEWMGMYGNDIARGETRISVFIDLAYLEAALLARLWDLGVLVDFGSPWAFFRRGALIDYANVYEAVVDMVLQGYSLTDTADGLAPQILKRLQLYANAYLQLSSLYRNLAWHIERDTFVVKFPDRRAPLVLQYWELRGDGASIQKTLQGWRYRIENLLQNVVADATPGFPQSFAA
jgi:hypothetical protein